MTLLLSLALADEPPEPTAVAGRLEFSFGSSLLIREQALAGQDFTRIVPVPSVLMLGEFLVTPRVSAVSYTHLRAHET